MIEPGHDRIPLSRQCELLGLPRASFYYRPRPITALEALLLRLIDEVYTQCPFYGVRRITAWLCRQGDDVNPKRVRRLMRQMGVQALYPRRHLSLPAPGHTKYPYLLRDLTIERPDQVWATDITYVRLASGFVYLTAIMGLAEPVRPVLGALHLAGDPVLSHRAGAGPLDRKTDDLQHRPRLAIYQYRVHRTTVEYRGVDQPGWARLGLR